MSTDLLTVRTIDLYELYISGKLNGDLFFTPIYSNYLIETHGIESKIVEIYGTWKLSTTPLLKHLMIRNLTPQCIIKITHTS